jgi:hypothetical protein
MPQMKSLQLAPIADLTPYLGDSELVALNVGPDLQLYAVIALNKLDYRIEASTGFSFAKTTPDSPQAYRVVALHDGTLTLDVRIASERFNIHDIQPLPNDELLLVCCRSCYKGPDDFERNGRIYSSTGELVREVLLGDGIQRVQTTSSGTIWTSFFDEGVFGNYGWSNPVGSSGLVAWDTHGKKLYEYEPAEGLDSICDCYALNVESESSIWLYYYTEFPLVHLRDHTIEAHWDIPVRGSGAFAVSNGFALFAGGYDKRNEYHLFELGRDGNINELTRLMLIDENKQRLHAESIVGRSDALYIVRGNQVYRCDVRLAAVA